MSNSTDIRQLIDQMKADELTGELNEAEELAAVAMSDANDKAGLVEVNQGPMLLALELARIKAQRTALERVEKAMSDALKEFVPTGQKGIQHNGQAIATTTVSHPRRINTKLLGELFPFEDYPNYYTETEQVTLYLDPEVKKAAIQGAIEEK